MGLILVTEACAAPKVSPKEHFDLTTEPSAAPPVTQRDSAAPRSQTLPSDRIAAFVEAAGQALRSEPCEFLRMHLRPGTVSDFMYADRLSGTETPLLVLAADSIAHQESTECVSVLLDQGAPVDGQVSRGPWKGDTALITASGHGNLPVVKLLLKRGADSNHAASANGHTALMSAAVYPDVAGALLQAGADQSAPDMAGRTAISFAGIGGCAKSFDFLQSQGSNPAVKDKHGKSAADYLRNFPKNGVALGVCNSKIGG